MTEKADPWWPLKWSDADDRLREAYAMINGRQVLVDEFPFGPRARYTVYPFWDTSGFDDPVTIEDLLEVRAFLLGLAYPGGNDGPD